jgi:hypothetical protein
LPGFFYAENSEPLELVRTKSWGYLATTRKLKLNKRSFPAQNKIRSNAFKKQNAREECEKS